MSADPKAWLNHLSERYRTELTSYMAAHSNLEAVMIEIGNNITAEKAERLVRAHLAEAQTHERYRDAQRDYVAFLQYMKDNRLLD